MATATKNGDYLLERNLTRVDLMINNLRYHLSKDLDKKLSEIGQMEQQLVLDINNIAKDALNTSSKKFLEAEEFLDMDINDIISRVPLFKDKIYISSIEGIGQKFRDKGFYTVTLKGNVFKFENRDSIFINGKLLKEEYITKNKKMFCHLTSL